jgi:3-oxoacyl-[acyl-carrier protein] reductase
MNGARSVEGLVTVVTGAASGMGRATARLFAADGAHVAVVDRAAEGLDEVVAEIDSAGGKAAAFALDVADRAAVDGLPARVEATFGPADVLVNCAGVSLPTPIDGPDFDRGWSVVLEVNLVAYARLARAFLGQLERDRRGRIVNVASTEGLTATASISAYTASKHGVIGLTKSLAVELGARGVCVNAVCPGPINTAMTDPIPDADKEKFARRRIPLRRYGEPEEVAATIWCLALPALSYTTGAVVTVDGGQTAKST